MIRERAASYFEIYFRISSVLKHPGNIYMHPVKFS